MRRHILSPVLACLVLTGLAGCSSAGNAGNAENTAAPASSTGQAPAGSQPPKVPAAPKPGSTAACPYLDKGAVATANGQRVSKVRISADKPHPACFFYALTGKLQVTVRVYTGDAAVATALVDQAAPVKTSSPATEPVGWRGGYQPTADGAVYAVAKGGAAVVVSTNQKQTVKARTIASRAIEGLKL